MWGILSNQKMFCWKNKQNECHNSHMSWTREMNTWICIFLMPYAGWKAQVNIALRDWTICLPHHKQLLSPIVIIISLVNYNHFACVKGIQPQNCLPCSTKKHNCSFSLSFLSLHRNEIWNMMFCQQKALFSLGFMIAWEAVFRQKLTQGFLTNLME